VRACAREHKMTRATRGHPGSLSRSSLVHGAPGGAHLGSRTERTAARGSTGDRSRRGDLALAQRGGALVHRRIVLGSGRTAHAVRAARARLGGGAIRRRPLRWALVSMHSACRTPPGSRRPRDEKRERLVTSTTPAPRFGAPRRGCPTPRGVRQLWLHARAWRSRIEIRSTSGCSIEPKAPVKAIPYFRLRQLRSPATADEDGGPSVRERDCAAPV
jgi:hypothetical protein